jgi:hypothetical protein
MPKPGRRSVKRLVIRFVTAKLKAATHLLRNRIRRMGASRTARSDMTHVAIVGCHRPHCSPAYSVLASFRMGMSGSASLQRVRKTPYTLRLGAIPLRHVCSAQLPVCQCPDGLGTSRRSNSRFDVLSPSGPKKVALWFPSTPAIEKPRAAK